MSNLSGYDMIIAASKHRLKGLNKSVLCWLTYFADRKTLTCYPSQETLADFIGCSDRRVRSSLKTLEEMKLITRKKQRIGNRQGSDLFTLSKKLFQADTVSGSKTGFQADKSATLRRTPRPGNYKEQEPLSAGAETAPRKNKMLRL